MQATVNKSTQIVYEVLDAITHGIGLIASAVWGGFLITKGVNAHLTGIQVTSLVVYVVSLLGLYLASTLFHCFVFTKASRVFQILDHSNIFLLIAGTYTPYCIIFINSSAGNWLLLTVWVLALSGIALHIWSQGKHQKIETSIYVIMGWLCMFLAKNLYVSLNPTGFWLLVAGGIVFTVGAVIYSFPKFPGLHLIWHFFVMAGTLLMFLSIYLNI